MFENIFLRRPKVLNSCAVNTLKVKNFLTSNPKVLDFSAVKDIKGEVICRVASSKYLKIKRLFGNLESA